MLPKEIRIVVDAGDNHPEPRLVEIENEEGKSIDIGVWLDRPDGLRMLVIPLEPPQA